MIPFGVEISRRNNPACLTKVVEHEYCRPRGDRLRPLCLVNLTWRERDIPRARSVSGYIRSLDGITSPIEEERAEVSETGPPLLPASYVASPGAVAESLFISPDDTAVSRGSEHSPRQSALRTGIVQFKSSCV